MVKLGRWLVIILLFSFLLACASARMAEEVQSGKATFNAGNFKQAFAELLPLAVKCSAEAQYAVGYMYYYGLGVEPHKESGLFWINQSAQQMYRPAIRALQIIEKENKEPFNAPEKKSIKLRYSENTLAETLKDPDIQKKMAEVKKANAVETDPLRLAVKLTPENKEEPSSVDTPKVASKEKVTPENKEDAVLESLKDLKPSSANKPNIVNKDKVLPKQKEKLNPGLKTAKLTTKDKFTLQLYGSFKLDDVKQLQSRLKLQKTTYYARTQHDGRDWYVLTYGKYSVPSHAKLAKKDMPVKAQKLNPWVRGTSELRWLA